MRTWKRKCSERDAGGGGFMLGGLPTAGLTFMVEGRLIGASMCVGKWGTNNADSRTDRPARDGHGGLVWGVGGGGVFTTQKEDRIGEKCKDCQRPLIAREIPTRTYNTGLNPYLCDPVGWR